MPRSKFPRTRRIAWELVMIIGGLLIASIAWMSLGIASTLWRRWLRLATWSGLFLSLVGAGLALYRHQHAMRGLGYGISPRRRLGGVVALLLSALIISLWPLPFPYAWIGNVLAIICGIGAVALGLGLVQSSSLDFRKARQAYERGKDDEALALLRSVEDQDPDFCPTYHLRGVIHRQGEHYEKAMKACHDLIDRCPDLYYGHAELGMTLLKNGEAREAIAPLERALEIAPDLPQAQFVLGMAQAQGGDAEQAIDSLSRALRMGLRNEVSQLLARHYLYRSLMEGGYEEHALRERRRLRRQRHILRRWLDGEDEQEYPIPSRQLHAVKRDLRQLLGLD